MATLRYKKRGNKWYVYNVHQYWDKELKKPRQKSTYLGVADEKGGEYKKPGPRVATKIEKEIVDFGDTFSIHSVAESAKLTKIIEDTFVDVDSIMALICFQTVEGSALYNCKDWIDGNVAKYLYKNAKTSSQDISRLLKTLGRQDLQTKFFKEYTKMFFKGKRGVLLDSTALPSSINAGISAFGYTSSGIMQNVTCLMLVDEESKLPIYFRPVGGEIADVSTLQTTVQEIKKLGVDIDKTILDAGFFSKDNYQFLQTQKINFVTRLPKSHNVFYEIAGQCNNLESAGNAVWYGDRVVFIQSKSVKIYGHDVFAHVILDPSKKSKDTQNILKSQDSQSLATEMIEKLDEKIKHAGVFILLSSKSIDKKEILPSYYVRQAIEQVFGFAKCNQSILPLRVHDEQSIRGYLMLVFLSLIPFILLRQLLKSPTDKCLLSLRNLKAKVFDDQLIVQEPNKTTKKILNDLNIIMPTSLGI